MPSVSGGVGLDWAQGTWLLLVAEGRWVHLLEPVDSPWLVARDGIQHALSARVSLFGDRVQLAPIWLHDWAFSEDLLEMEELGVRVTDDGFTVIDPAARRVRCATGWKDLPAFEDLLVDRLIGP